MGYGDPASGGTRDRGGTGHGAAGRMTARRGGAQPLPTADDLATWEASFERVNPLPGFLERFYELFVATSDDVASLFARTDFHAQVRVLSAALAMIGMLARGDEAARGPLRHIAAAHDRRHLDIDPALYDPWLDCLVRAASEHDPLWSADVERAWRRVVGVGARLFQRAWAATDDVEPVGGEEVWRREHGG